MSKSKRTQLDRNIELRQGIEDKIYSIFYTAIRQQQTFQEILDNASNYKNNYSSFPLLPRYMRSEIHGAEHALFRLIDWHFIETRFRITAKGNTSMQFLTKEDIERLNISWSEVERLGSYWKEQPNKLYSPEKENAK